MNTIQQWKNGSLQNIPHFRRIVITPEPNCNLACDHCYFAHNKVNPGPDTTDWSECINTALDLDILIFCAGRIITPRVIRFCEEYLQTADAQAKPSHLSLVDNGYTVFNLDHLFDRIETFNISIDGADAQHDIQRKKIGSSRVAWNSIYKLKEMGYDPLLSSCMSPITMIEWNEFEKEVVDADIRLSVSLTLQIENTRANTLYQNHDERKKAIDVLISGIPKSIQIYDPRDVRALLELIGDVDWSEDDLVPGLITELNNGVQIVYRPMSILWNAEFIVHYDGKIHGQPRETNLTFDQIVKEERQLFGFV